MGNGRRSQQARQRVRDVLTEERKKLEALEKTRTEALVKALEALDAQADAESAATKARAAAGTAIEALAETGLDREAIAGLLDVDAKTVTQLRKAAKAATPPAGSNDGPAPGEG